LMRRPVIARMRKMMPSTKTAAWCVKCRMMHHGCGLAEL